MNKHNRRTGRDSGDPEHGDVEGEGTFRENRWCERHGYFIDLNACEARAKTRPSCRRCIARWLQLSFPFMAT